MDRKVDYMKDIRKINVTIQRYDAEKGESFLQNYSVEIETSRVSVINVLDTITESIDSSLAFYGPCRIGKCSGCLMTINGRVGYACATLVEGDIILGPVPDRKILVDLVTYHNDLLDC